MAILPTQKLPKNASIEDIKSRLQDFKIVALNLIVSQIENPNAQHLEPKEIKTLTDVALNLEDSYTHSEGEGEQARKIKRLLEKYGDSDSMPASTPKVLEGELVHKDD